MTNTELIEYYVNLLIIQYRTKERAPQHIAALINTIMIFELMRAVETGYNIDTAVGVQLDVLGKYLGLDRVVTGTSFTRDYFGYEPYGATAPFTFFPYAQYGVDPGDVQYRSYSESNQSLFTLNDEEFRTILMLKIIQNNSEYTPYDIDNFVEEFFEGNAIFTDRQNMTISYIFDQSIERLVTIAKSEDLLPKPAAVRLSVSFTTDINNIFGYCSYGCTPPSWLTGYSQYGVTPVGGMATYG